MRDESESQGRAVLSEELRSELDSLTVQQLRDVVDYARDRLRKVHEPVSEQIEAGPGEEIIFIEERPEYTEVVKREPCGENCPDCPHGPYVYHVYEEIRPDGSTSLHWVFLGRRYDPSRGEHSE